jgi:hypothetical protein
MVIWAKLTQGNGRGTCFWITHILNVYGIDYTLFCKFKLILRFVALSGCPDVRDWRGAEDLYLVKALALCGLPRKIKP